MNPHAIEAKSFQIIDAEAGDHGFNFMEWQVVRRMIHTSADFDYLDSIRFHPKAVAAGISAIKSGKDIITDTQMARMGIRHQVTTQFGSQVLCFINDPIVVRQAKDLNTTRAQAAVDQAAMKMDGGIYVVGNAPTALLRLLQLMKNGQANPALVIGLPVGFVNAAESKAGLLQADIPYITNTGRKGGSNVAAGVVNALILLAVSEKK